MQKDSDDRVLEQFTLSFRILDPFAATLDFLRANAASANLRVTDDWYVVRHRTPASALDDLYRGLPLKFPPLFERLLLSYRWTEADLGICRLTANLQQDNSLIPFRSGIYRDKSISSRLLDQQLLPFGRGTADHDPICFDGQNCLGDNMRIIKADHEEIICNSRIVIVSVVANSFRDLVEKIIKRATES